MLLSGLIIIFWFIAENEAWELIEDIGTAGNMYRGGSVYCEKRDSMIFFAGSYADQNRKSFLVEDMREYIFTSSSWNVIHEQSNTSCPSRYGFSFNPLVSTENGVCQALVIGGVISIPNHFQTSSRNLYCYLMGISYERETSNMEVPFAMNHSQV
jgi:hypothetical protein